MTRAKFTHKELQMGIKEMMGARAQRFDTLTFIDVMAMMGVAFYDGDLSQAEYNEIVQVASQFADKFSSDGIYMIQRMIQDCASYVTVANHNLQLARQQPTRQQMPPPVGIDPKLVGRWNYTKYYSAGTFSSTTSRDMVLYSDGRFAENGSVGANLRVTDAGGNWKGTTSAYSDANPSEYGRWEARDGILTLNYADNTYILYSYSTWGEPGDRSLLTRSAKGKELFWKEY